MCLLVKLGLSSSFQSAWKPAAAGRPRGPAGFPRLGSVQELTEDAQTTQLGDVKKHMGQVCVEFHGHALAA